MKKSIKIVFPIILVFVASSVFLASSNGIIRNKALSTVGEQPEVRGDALKDNRRYTIRVASMFTGADPFLEVWHEALADFQSRYPHITVIDEATPAAGDAFKTKINTDFASGNEPDVTFGFNGNIGDPICRSGKVITWEEELKNDPQWAENFYPDTLESSKWMGKLYCLPFLGSFEGVWINKDLFEKNRLKIPETYDDILASIPVFKSQGITPIVCSFSEEPHYLIETFILSSGGKEGHANPFDPSWVKGLNHIKELYDKGAFNEDALVIKQSESVDRFVNKKAAMFICGSWSAGKFKDKENTAIIPLPPMPNSNMDPRDIIGVIGEGWYLAKALNTEKEGSGMEFIKYMTRPGIMDKYASIGGIPCIKNTVKVDTPMRQSFTNFVNMASSMNRPLGDTINQESFTTLWQGLSYVVTGKMTAEQLIEDARKAAYK